MPPEDYQQPLLRIRLPFDEPSVDPQVEQDRKTTPPATISPGVPLDPRVRIISGLTTPLRVGASRQFQALTYDLSDTRITWSISHGAGEIDQHGLYTAPVELPSDVSVTVRAASTAFPELYDERTFPLTDGGQTLTLRIVNTCGQVPVGGSNCRWSITSVGLTHEEPVNVVAPGAVGEQTSQLVDTRYMGPVTLHLVWVGALYNGQAAVDFLALRLDDTTYEVDLCDPSPEWTYFNTQQSYTATCPGDSFGNPVTHTVSAGAFSSHLSQAAANALALAAAQAAAEAGLSCRLLELRLGADALNARGGIVLGAAVQHWNGNADWVLTIGAVRRTSGPGNYLDPGNFIKDTEFGNPYLAENITFHTDPPNPISTLGYNAYYTTGFQKHFYFDSIDPRWQIGNSDGDTWLIDVTVRVTLTDVTPNRVLTQTWKKYLLI